jgi:hypothetical protein
MNETAELAVVFTEGESRVEARDAASAQTAETRSVEGRRIQERGSAAGAKVLGDQRARRGEAAAAYGNAGDFGESGAADAAVIGENEGKKGSRYPADSVSVDVWRC